MKRLLPWLTVLLLGAIFSMGCGISSLFDDPSSTPLPAAQRSETGAGPAPTLAPIVIPTAILVAGYDPEETLLINLYERVGPSVVFITVQVSGGSSSSATAEASGSGFVFDGDGHIVTNNHVIENASKIRVKFSDALDVEGKVIGRDPDSDLAVLLVKVPATALRPVALGDSNALRVGQRAVAIGNPFGFERAMSVGYVSAVGRVIRLADTGFSLPELIQTDAAINPGNSGGPLLDAKGQVIGVTTLIYSRSGVNSGVGLAIPVETVKRVVPELINSGTFAHPWLGISAYPQSINDDMAQQLSLPVQYGALIQDVTAGGPAAKAGLRAGTKRGTFNGQPVLTGGDIIVAIDGHEVRNFDDVIIYLAKNTKVGQQIEVTVVRDSGTQKVAVTLGERPR
jgi:S1-C subfamily serine protease